MTASGCLFWKDRRVFHVWEEEFAKIFDWKKGKFILQNASFLLFLFSSFFDNRLPKTYPHLMDS